jgi:hypothetical protein
MIDGPLICLAGFGLVVVLLLVRVPIAVSLGIVGLGGLALLLSPEAAVIHGAYPVLGRGFDAPVQRRRCLRWP